MIYLSEAALQYAVAKCREEGEYKIGIIPNQKTDKLHIFHSLGNYLSTISDFTVKTYAERTDILFDNKSYIRIIPAAGISRGFRHHLLIVDKEVDEDVLNTVLKPTEVLEYIKITDKYKTNNEGDS